MDGGSRMWEVGTRATLTNQRFLATIDRSSFHLSESPGNWPTCSSLALVQREVAALSVDGR